MNFIKIVEITHVFIFFINSILYIYTIVLYALNYIQLFITVIKY